MRLSSCNGRSASSGRRSAMVSTLRAPWHARVFGSSSSSSNTSNTRRWLLAGPVRATGVEEQQAELKASSAPHAEEAAPPQQSLSTSSSSKPPAERIQRTLADLDALLGIEPDAPPSAAPPSSSPSAATSSSSGTTSSSPTTPGLPRADDKIEEHLKRIADKARRLADEQQNTQGGQAEQQQLRQEFETMLQSISASPAALDKEDIKRLKEAAFGPQTFFVTETQTLTQADRTGLLVRGNLRDERTKVYQHICAKVTELFGDKYTVLMVEDEAAMQDGAAGGVGGAGPGGLGPQGLGSSVSPRQSDAATRAQQLNTPRIAFQIIPAAQAVPPQSNGWKRAVAVALLLLFLGSCGQLALAANITKLPRETLEWFSNPANFESDQLPPGLESWDPLPYFSTAVPIFGAVTAGNLVHEIGHRVAALARGVKVGPTYFIPNFQIGSFGGITPITSLLKDRLQLWDVAAAGPLAGVLFSVALLAVGLSQSQPGALPAEALVPVPTPLFQGSLLLGGVTRIALGEAALRAAEVPVSPLVIAGWCGLITQALQLLPVGAADGGRMVQGAYGKGALSLTSLFTYVGLALGLLGSSLALPYGIYLLVCLRTPERYIADNVTPAGDARATATWAAVLFAVLVLVPMAPELSEAWGVGPGRDAFFF